MSVHLARLIRPRVEGLVRRERLFAALDDAHACPVIWISAPAGAGKTSLVASYLEQRGRAGPWFQLERADGDPAAFFLFLHRAASAVPGVRAERLPRHSIEYARDCTGFALRFFHRLHGELGGDSVVVLDNYQELPPRSPMHRALAAVAAEWPSTGHLVCISRADPPSAFARLRAAQALAIFDWNALRLRLEEVRAIVAARRDLSTDLVARLHEQSGGWAAGLVLLLERLRQAGSFDAFGSASDLQAVFDYFADQVFRACPEATREMLLRLSYLPRITASSAAQITNRGDAAELLVEFARRNLFIGQSAPQDESFEFHALFRAFLQHRARELHGEAGHARLTREAAELLLAGGLVDDAVQRLLEMRAWRRAREIVLREAPRMIATGRRETLRRWIGALPRRMLDDPWLAYWLGVAYGGRDARARTQALERAYAAFAAGGERRGQVLALSAQMSGWWGERGDFRWLDPVLDRLAELLSEQAGLDRETEAAAISDLVNAWPMLRPMRDEVHALADRLRRQPLRELPRALALHAGVCLMAYCWMRGDSDELDAVARAVHELVDDPEAAITDRLWFHFWTMTHHVYRADAARAMEAMERARTVTEEANLAPGRIDLARWATTVDMQLGRADRARRRLDDELVPLFSSMAPTAAVFVHLELTRCAIEEGRIDEALKQGRIAAAVALRCGYTWAQVPARLSWCGALCLDGRPAQARRQLARVRRLVTARIPMQLASVEFYEALVCLTEGDRAGARTALERCFALRAATSYVWGPGWTRPVAARLAAFAFEHDVRVAEMTRIVRGLRLPAPAPAPARWPWPVRIRAFGTFSLDVDDAGAQQPAGKAAHRLTGLLKALVAAGGIDVSGDALIDAIWPDAAGDAGWSSLHTAVHRLRRLLRHEEAIFVHDNKVSLSRTACWLDTWEFLDRTTATETQAAAIDALDECAAGSLRAALALYRDHLLAGEADAPWLLAAREAMRQRWLAAVHALARWHECRCDWPGAAEVFRSAMRIDPGDEGLCRGLMSSLAAAGEPGEALASYECWARLARSRGLPAGEAIRRLRDRLAGPPVRTDSVKT